MNTDPSKEAKKKQVEAIFDFWSHGKPLPLPRVKVPGRRLMGGDFAE